MRYPYKKQFQELAELVRAQSRLPLYQRRGYTRIQPRQPSPTSFYQSWSSASEQVPAASTQSSAPPTCPWPNLCPTCPLRQMVPLFPPQSYMQWPLVFIRPNYFYEQQGMNYPANGNIPPAGGQASISPTRRAPISYPQGSSSQYVGPQPVGPQGGEQQNVGYAGPQYGEQQNIGPQYAESQYAGPQYVGPQYSEQQYVGPQSVGPQYGEQQHVGPQYGEPQYVGRQYGGPQNVGPQYFGPYVRLQHVEPEYGVSYRPVRSRRYRNLLQQPPPDTT